MNFKNTIAGSAVCRDCAWAYTACLQASNPLINGRVGACEPLNCSCVASLVIPVNSSSLDEGTCSPHSLGLESVIKRQDRGLCAPGLGLCGQQVVHAVNEIQAKAPPKTAPTTARSIPQPKPINLNYRTPTMVTRSRNPDNIRDNAASDSSSIPIEGTKIDEARKKIGKRR
ncbi:hypothetical protein CBL_01795 [Carabus blaptoides fortunei]